MFYNIVFKKFLLKNLVVSAEVPTFALAFGKEPRASRRAAVLRRGSEKEAKKIGEKICTSRNKFLTLHRFSLLLKGRPVKRTLKDLQ